MNRKTFRNKMLDLKRRLYFETEGTYKGFGKIARYYRRNFRVDFKECNRPYFSYSEIWNSELFKNLRIIARMQ